MAVNKRGFARPYVLSEHTLVVIVVMHYTTAYQYFAPASGQYRHPLKELLMVACTKVQASVHSAYIPLHSYRRNVEEWKP